MWFKFAPATHLEHKHLQVVLIVTAAHRKLKALGHAGLWGHGLSTFATTILVNVRPLKSRGKGQRARHRW